MMEQVRPRVATRVLSVVAGLTGLVVLALSVVMLLETSRYDGGDSGAYGFALILGCFVAAVGLLALAGGVIGWLLARRLAGLFVALFGATAGAGLLLLVAMFLLSAGL